MINSNERKLALSGWLQERYPDAFRDPLRLQKFLFLYEADCKASGEAYDFSYLRGYKRGPVFSQVYGDHTKNRAEFSAKAHEAFLRMPSLVNADRALKAGFVVICNSDKELSDITHKFDIWSAKQNRIAAGEQNVSLSEKDFSEKDAKFVKSVIGVFPIEEIESSTIVRCDEKYFMFSSKDAERLTETNYDTLYQLAQDPELYNPVVVEIDEKGALVIYD